MGGGRLYGRGRSRRASGAPRDVCRGGRYVALAAGDSRDNRGGLAWIVVAREHRCFQRSGRDGCERAGATCRSRRRSSLLESFILRA